MRKSATYIAVATMLSITSGTALAANVEVEWKDPKKYTDVRPTNETKSKFRKRTLNRLEEYIVELGQDLPENHKLNMTVSNLDLAGQVWPASFVGIGHGGSDVRLIKRGYIPRMNFSYQLFDEDGNEIRTAEIKLKDMGFQDRANRFFRDEILKYEKTMLKNWFEDEFADVLVSKN